MSDIRTIAKSAAEPLKKFNPRLRAACMEMPITSFEAVVADGEPVVTLISELVEADEDMVREDGAGTNLKVGDFVPENAPIVIQVLRVGTVGDYAARAESHTNTVNERADGTVEEVRFVTGRKIDWIRDRNDFDKEGTREIASTPHWVMVEVEVVYAVIAHLANLAEMDQGEDDDDGTVTAGAGNGKATKKKA